MELHCEGDKELLDRAETLIQDITVLALEGNTNDIIALTKEYWKYRARAQLRRRREAKQNRAF